MTRKKFLIICMVIISVTGIGFLFVPFFSSLKPNLKSEASLQSLDISNIKPGQYIYIPHPSFGRMWDDYHLFILIYRAYSGKIIAWEIPMKNGHVGMPDIVWWRPFYECLDFGPTRVNGFINEELPITCHDSNLPSEWWRKEWRWNFEGKNVNGMVKPLTPTKFVIKGKYMILGKNS